jgi:hypothetical protein
MPSNEAFLDCIFVHLPHLCLALGGSGVAREALELGGWRAGGHPEKRSKEAGQLIMVIGRLIS